MATVTNLGKTSQPKKRNNKVRYGWAITPYLFVLPAIFIILLMMLYPLGYGFYISVTDLSLSNFARPQLVHVIWFDKYIDFFVNKDQLATHSWYASLNTDTFMLFWRTIVWTAVNVFFGVTIGLMLAILLNRKLPGKSFLRILLILPWATPQYIVALTWKGMFNYQYGAVNTLLGMIGIDKIPWLSSGSWPFIACILTNIWLSFPFMMMISLGGLQAIPSELYEAAEIDGASSWQQFKTITLPLLKPVLVPATVLSCVWTFNQIGVIYIMVGQGNPDAQILITQVYKMAFTFFAYGKAAALSVIIFLVLLAFATSFIKVMKGTEEVY